MSLCFPRGSAVKNPPCPCRRQRRRRFDPWVWKIPWRRAWQPTPIFLPGEPHRQRSPVGYGPQGGTESDSTEASWHGSTGASLLCVANLSGSSRPVNTSPHGPAFPTICALALTRLSRFILFSAHIFLYACRQASLLFRHSLGPPSTCSRLLLLSCPALALSPPEIPPLPWALGSLSCSPLLEMFSKWLLPHVFPG